MADNNWTLLLGLRMGLTRRGQSRAELAEELGKRLGKRWTETMVNELVAGRKRITAEILVAISEIQRLPLDYYAYGRGTSRFANEDMLAYLSSADGQLIFDLEPIDQLMLPVDPEPALAA